MHERILADRKERMKWRIDVYAAESLFRRGGWYVRYVRRRQMNGLPQTGLKGKNMADKSHRL